MTAETKYKPQVGDRVRLDSWAPGDAAEVRGVDGDELWLKFADGGRESCLAAEDWIKVQPKRVWPEMWIVIHDRYWADAYATHELALKHANGAIGIVRLAPSGETSFEDVTCRPVVEWW